MHAVPLARNTSASELSELGTTPHVISLDNKQEHTDNDVIPDQGEHSGQERVAETDTVSQAHEQRPQEPLPQIPTIPQPSAEDMPQSSSERRKHTLSENDYILLQSIVSKYTNSANSLALSKEPVDMLVRYDYRVDLYGLTSIIDQQKRPIPQDATHEPLSADCTLLFFRCQCNS